MRRTLAIILLMMFLTVPYSTASSVLEGASKVFVGVDSYADSVPLKAYSILALGSMVGKVQNGSLVMASIKNLTESLLALQNPDGGWGHGANQISTPHDTALVILALNSSLTASRASGIETGEDAVVGALIRARGYLLSSFSSPGWGYAAGSAPRFYPTALALWALGTLGFNYSNSLTIKTAADFIAEASSLPPEYQALRLIAFHAIGYPNVTPYLSECHQLLSSGNLNEYQRAILTYAVMLYEPLDFEVGKSLAMLEGLGMRNETYLLANRAMPFMTESNLIATAYAVMAFSSVSDVTSEGHLVNPRAFLYDELISRQNSNGGWPIFTDGLSSAKATYYALLGILSYENPSEDAVRKALAWAEGHLPSAMEEAELRGTITEDYYYTAMILTEFGNLSSEDREELINFTRSLEFSPGLWRGLFAIPQPYETALGLNLLISLGYSGEDIERGAKWLLSVSNAGWGVRLNYFLPATTGKDVPTTVAVLEALSKVVPPEKLVPHAEWLIEQRLPSGVWGYFGRSVNMLGEVSYGVPSVEYTIRAADVLKSLGYDYSEEVLHWTLENALNASVSTADMGLALHFLSRFNLIPPTTLHEVMTALGEGPWYVNYWEGYEPVAKEIASSLSEGVEIKLVEGNMTPGEGNHIIVAPIGRVDVSRYNSVVHVEANGTSVIVDGSEYPLSTSIVIVPGRTHDGYVLMILAGGDAVGGVPVLFTSGMYRYLHGNYMVLTASDSNGDGEIGPEEITLLAVG
ncbi:hypothetical protein TEU_04005 [Thermococcus eurythermalis]|uniref:Squalene cyclase C-terminal domain-containing protein n=1 Tax=Thermococcus eurythermalis TaxID=1505907 RepID=A0A097QSY1_9EURY|nr:prenyltransferase/squalene oxidase repeat-containing protein [Thermococcus eurythermalis]AIU69569.1 hypothetical protein TEU_04005 [Thermococcus eurythermalis]